MQNIDLMLSKLDKIQSEKNKTVADATADVKELAGIVEYLMKKTVLSQSI